MGASAAQYLEGHNDTEAAGTPQNRDTEVQVGRTRRAGDSQEDQQRRQKRVQQGRGVYLKGYTMEPVLPEPPVVITEGRYLRNRVVG